MSSISTVPRRPLAGRRVLVPRKPHTGDHLAVRVRELGGEPIFVPLIEHLPPRDEEALIAAVAQWNRAETEWAAITSVRGAEAFIRAGATPGSGLLASVGSATTAALRRAGFTVHVEPDEYTGADLASLLLRVLAQRNTFRQGVRVLLPLSEIAEPTLEDALRAAGHEPVRVDAYRTVMTPSDPVRDTQIAQQLDAALVLSASSARALAKRFPKIHDRAVIAAIGEPTARELARVRLPATVVAREHTAHGTLNALAEFIAAQTAAERNLASRTNPDHEERS